MEAAQFKIVTQEQHNLTSYFAYIVKISKKTKAKQFNQSSVSKVCLNCVTRFSSLLFILEEELQRQDHRYIYQLCYILDQNTKIIKTDSILQKKKNKLSCLYSVEGVVETRTVPLYLKKGNMENI